LSKKNNDYSIVNSVPQIINVSPGTAPIFLAMFSALLVSIF
jgi:hypothetical protein